VFAETSSQIHSGVWYLYAILLVHYYRGPNIYEVQGTCIIPDTLDFTSILKPSCRYCTWYQIHRRSTRYAYPVLPVVPVVDFFPVNPKSWGTTATSIKDNSLIDADTTRPCFDFRIYNENLETIPLWPIYFVGHVDCRFHRFLKL